MDSTAAGTRHQAPAEPTDDDIRFQLLSLIVDRKGNDTPIDVSLLHEELGLDEALVQRCLVHLQTEGLIIAMRGDEQVGVVLMSFCRPRKARVTNADDRPVLPG